MDTISIFSFTSKVVENRSIIDPITYSRWDLVREYLVIFIEYIYNVKLSLSPSLSICMYVCVYIMLFIICTTI